MAAPDLIFARPERLGRFVAVAGGMADGLDRRRGALADAAAHHRLRTEPAYRVDGEVLVDELRALSRRLRALGDWVGDVGHAFEAAGHGLGDGVLAASVGAVVALGGVLGPGRAATSGSGSVGSGSPAEAAAGGEAASGGATGPARIGFGEGVRRWELEADRPPAERAARAAVDGLLNGAGAYLGAARGSAIGATVCGPTEAIAPTCMAAGGLLGGWLGRQVGEFVSDRLLGDEPDPAGPDPEAVAAEVGDVDEATVDALAPLVDAAATDAAGSAERHADFVLDHPWLWDDDHPDAPHHDPPPPAPVPPLTGPR